MKSQAEIEAEQMTMHEVAMMTLVRPFVLGFREPVVAFWNVYLAMVYGRCLCTTVRSDSLTRSLIGILYCFIASFDVVFIEHHHFNLAQNGLAFMVRPQTLIETHLTDSSV